MEHKITVQGTNEVYERTKQQMEIAEKLRKEQRTQEIKVPQGMDRGSSFMYFISVQYNNIGRNKHKTFQPVTERVSPVPISRKPCRPKVPVSGFSKLLVKSGSSAMAKSQHSKSKTAAATAGALSYDSKPNIAKQIGRNTHRLKDRVIHMLALRPQTREQIVAKLKKGKIMILVH